MAKEIDVLCEVDETNLPCFPILMSMQKNWMMKALKEMKKEYEYIMKKSLIIMNVPCAEIYKIDLCDFSLE